MPLNFPKNNTTQFPDLLGGDPDSHVTASRDALLNYTRLMEDIGPTTYAPPGAAVPADGAAPPAGAEPEADAPKADAAAATDAPAPESTPAADAVSQGKSSPLAAVSGANK